MVKKKEEKENIDKEDLLKKLQEEVEKLTAPQLMGQMASNLASLGFKFLGMPPENNSKYRDLKQAKLVIDGLDALMKVLEDSIAAEEIQVLKSALSNLQILYVKEAEKDKNMEEKKE